MAQPEFAILTSDDLVTGEAVALDLPPAGLGVRMVSGLIDLAVTFVLLFVLLIIFGIATAGADEALATVAVIVVSVLTFVGFPTLFETLTRGRTLGKLAMGLRTVREDAGPISAQHALIRALIGFVEIYLFFGMPAFYSMLVSGRGKRLADFAAGTYVVRSRVPLTLPLPPYVQPYLMSWAQAADVGSLPPGLALGVRQYLGRLPQLDPASRASVGVRLADRVAPYVAPLPPRNTRPEDFLAAVIAICRERDLARMRRQAEFRHRLVTRGAAR